MGRMRSGKDTVASRLVKEHAYTRIAFADPLKAMAMALDPIVSADQIGVKRLRAVVESYGWERAKDEFPEVRRVLQHMGQSQRALDLDYWVRLLLPKVDNADKWSLPVVVTDVRYRNEAEALKARGFRMVRVIRPDSVTTDTPADRHESEVGLDRWTPDAMILNASSIAELHRRADMLPALP
jgi:glyoxylate carboligase